MSAPKRWLHRRIMLAFAGFTTLVTLVFGLYVFVFAYSVEDLFFDALLEQEAGILLEQYRESGHWGEPRAAGMSLVEHVTALPDGIHARLVAEPGRTEFAGDEGRHFHLRALEFPSQGSLPATALSGAWLVAEVSDQLVVRPRRGALIALLGWSGAAMIGLALLLGAWLAHRIATPLSRLAVRVDASDADALPRGLADDFPDDEAGVLARALDRMVARVEAFVLREREFTRDASHELRTPLTVIRSAAELLAREPHLSVVGRTQVEHVLHSARQLEQTVATLLALAREDRAAGVGSDERTAVLPVLERVIVEQSSLLEGKPVEVDIAVSPDARIAAPEAAVHILLANLVGNAFAHTDDGVVRIDVDDGRLRIVNPGGGVQEADFQPHVRGEGSAGHGLGLAIVRRLCERYGVDLRIGTQAGRTVAGIRLLPPSPATSMGR
ncbi:sensor histidine kinase [Luteimonas abyssi]|uniref:sensor histidine kinase n=1 Tax=Luteimonas abyssi TaxID=1247514 RepID=UPI000737B3C3|nr:HAMP domain-containing sensor histidine kinase [Luteimonas abyssi]